MLVNGHDIDKALRRAKRQHKGARGSVDEAQVARRVADLLATRDYYRMVVHARFDLDQTVQVSLATAIHYAKEIRAPRRSRLRKQITEARRVRLEVEDWNESVCNRDREATREGDPASHVSAGEAEEGSGGADRLGE